MRTDCKHLVAVVSDVVKLDRVRELTSGLFSDIQHYRNRTVTFMVKT